MLRACAGLLLFAASACRLFAPVERPPAVYEPAPLSEPVAQPPARYEPTSLSEPVAQPEPLAAAPVEVAPVAVVELAALQAVLGRTAGDPAVSEVLARLGTRLIRDGGRWKMHEFREHGVVVLFAADGRASEVALLRGGSWGPGWRGDLPGGLRFGMSDDEVGRGLGVHIPLREVGRKGDARVLKPATEGGRTFRRHGLRVYFESGGLARVSLLPSAGPGSVHLDDVIAYPTAQDGVRGLKVYYQVSVAAGDCSAFDVSVRMDVRSHGPVRARQAASRRGEPAPFAAVDKQVPCAGADRAIFVPFGGLELPAGSHEGGLHLAAARAKAKRPIAEGYGPLMFDMPPVTLVRLKISRMEIKREVFSRRNTAGLVTFGLSSLFKRPKLAPDPFWVLEAGPYFHRSKVKASTFTPKWSESTKWFGLAEGDTITLHVADEDLADNERLAVIRVGLDQLRAAIRDGTPLSGGSVERIELDGSELRDAP